MRPSFFISPRLVIPTTSEVNTTGTIIILMRLMNIVPIGAIHHLMNGRLSGPTISPTTTDKTNEMKILIDKFIMLLPPTSEYPYTALLYMTVYHNVYCQCAKNGFFCCFLSKCTVLCIQN